MRPPSVSFPRPFSSNRRGFALALALLAPTRAWRAGVITNVLLDWRQQAESCSDPKQPDYMAVVHVAMFDAVNSVVGKYTAYKSKVSAAPGSSPEAAVASAAHDVLAQLCAGQKGAIDALLKTSLSAIKDSAAKANGVAVGQKVASEILAARAGSKAEVPDPFYVAGTAGVYVPTTRQIGMHWARQTPWVMTSPSELRPPAPPKLASREWTHDYNEIKNYGGKTSTLRTPEQTEIGKFWGGHDSRILVRQLVTQPGRSLIDNARLLALVEIAWADAYVAMMDGKYAYNFWRPITAIRGGATDGNDETAADSTWEPLIGTPAHPEYPCGHCMTAGAVGAVVEAEFGPTMPTVVIDEPGTYLRRWTSAKEFIDEVSEARIFGGVHYRNSVNVGRDMGVAIGKLTVERYLRPAGAVQAGQRRPSGRR